MARHQTIEVDVVAGVHRITDAYTNCYLVVENGEVTVVDAAFPGTWTLVQRCLDRVGLDRSRIRALLLTHGHFDHVGFARRLRAEASVPVWVHPSDRRLAAHPFRYRPERNRVGFSLLHPRALPVLGAMVGAGALSSRGTAVDEDLIDGHVVDVPGHPVVIHVPGHTDGEVALHLPGRSALISGDALVTLDPYTGATGPRLVAPAATSDSVQARASLQQLRGLGAETVLPGHGEPWSAGSDAAVEAAWRA